MSGRSLFLVLCSWFLVPGCCLFVFLSSSGSTVANEPGTKSIYRPKPGEFPPLEKAHTYRGELIYVDHANRRGSIRIQTDGKFRFIPPNPFAMLPFGIVRYHGATADLRDVPLGTMMHVHAYLPPDPKTSAVPVLPVDNRNKKEGNAGVGSAPAENHVLLLEDEPSYCRRTGKVWKLKEVSIENNAGMIVARREAKESQEAGEEESLTFDAATRIWRGREFLGVQELIAEGIWPSSGKKSLDDQPALVGITWKPTPGGVFNRFHISDIWLDEAAIERAARHQNETHKSFIRSRWMPAFVDAVEYGEFGRATVTATLFGGMDESLYADFKKGSRALMAPSENTLKHWSGGTAGTAQMAAKGPITDVTRLDKNSVPLGSSGIRIRFETDLITEGIRSTKVVQLRPANWPDLHVPREEYLRDHKATHEERFPTPDIFPKY